MCLPEAQDARLEDRWRKPSATHFHSLGTALEVAEQYAGAYAEGDYERVRELVTEDVLEREINPGGYVEFRGPAELIDEAREFTGKYGDAEVLELTVEPAGSLVINRWRLRRDGEPVLCDFYELLAVDCGKVARIDLVCSGTIPER